MTVQISNRTLAGAFDAFDDNLKLEETERRQAIDRWGEVRECLLEDSLCVDTFLQGSFGRKTMRKPLRDVDMVVLVSDRLVAVAEQEVGEKGASSPEVVMQYFVKALRTVFPTATFQIGAKALMVQFDDVPFTVDLTPARDSKDRWVQIGNTESREWELSDTRIVGDRASARNQKCKGRFVRQVRMVREMVAQLIDREPRFGFIKGLTAESLAYMAIQSPVEHRYAMRLFLRRAREAVLGPIYTPSGEDDLTEKHEWTEEQRQAAQEAFSDLLEQVEEALELENAGALIDAQWVWRDILGQEFPAPASSEAEELHRALQGSVTRSGVVTTSLVTPIQVVPQRAWAP